MHEENKDLATLFIAACRQVLSVKKMRNQAWMAKGAGISSKTLSRFLQRETVLMDKKNMSMLAKFLLSDTVANGLDVSLKKGLKNFLNLEDASREFSKEENEHKKIERFLLENRDMALLVYLFSCNESGLSASDLVALGEDARFYLQKFLEKKWISEKNNSYHAKNKEFSITKGFLLQRLATVFLQRMNPHLWDRADNCFFFYTQSLSAAANKEITGIIAEASRRIEVIANDTTKFGTQPTAIVLFQDYLKKSTA